MLLWLLTEVIFVGHWDNVRGGERGLGKHKKRTYKVNSHSGYARVRVDKGCGQCGVVTAVPVLPEFDQVDPLSLTTACAHVDVFFI